jgi:hypothetical protein
MKNSITLLISCSLALAATAMAQQDEEQGKPKKEKQEKSQTATEAKPSPKAQSVRKEQTETKTPGQNKRALKTQSTESTPKAQAETKVKGKEPGNATATGQEQGVKGKKERNARNEAATMNKPASLTPSGANMPSPTPAVSQANPPNPQGNKLNAQAKKPDPQTIQKITTEHANFRAQPRPDKVPTVTFNQSYRISGSEQWQGPQYQVFRSYHPERHDQGWYRSHFNRVELIGGGYYYWNNGYWYPAWGYDPSAEYYAYDGPIYVGHNAEPPDRVIADVQASLQEMGYYQGEVDGLLGPLTRQALSAYQADNGLYVTATIDEPTLESLGMG